MGGTRLTNILAFIAVIRKVAESRGERPLEGARAPTTRLPHALRPPPHALGSTAGEGRQEARKRHLAVQGSNAGGTVISDTPLKNYWLANTEGMKRNSELEARKHTL